MEYHLKSKFSPPLSREYEAWLTQAIENYFKKINISCDVFALSHHEEANFPVDEIFHYRGKMFGLQIKRVEFDGDKLSWTFANTQHNIISQEGIPIYYALPTFINRELKINALDHFVFCKPTTLFSTQTKKVFYEKTRWTENVSIDNKKENIARWGKFIESLYLCEIGKKICFTNIKTKRKIVIDDILDLGVPTNVLNEITRYKNIFNFTNEFQNTENNMLDNFKEYLKLLEVKNNKKTDINQEEDILLLIIIKS